MRFALKQSDRLLTKESPIEKAGPRRFFWLLSFKCSPSHALPLVIRHPPKPHLKRRLPVLPRLLVRRDGEGVNARVVACVE